MGVCQAVRTTDHPANHKPLPMTPHIWEPPVWESESHGQAQLEGARAPCSA